MINLLLDILLFSFLAKKRTPAGTVVAITAIVLVILVVTVIRQATYVP